MDFIISLAHFCEVHGPTSILCTQVLPYSCLTCSPLDSRVSRHGSTQEKSKHAEFQMRNASSVHLDTPQQTETPGTASAPPATSSSTPTATANATSTSTAKSSHGPLSPASALLQKKIALLEQHIKQDSHLNLHPPSTLNTPAAAASSSSSPNSSPSLSTSTTATSSTVVSPLHSPQSPSSFKSQDTYFDSSNSTTTTTTSVGSAVTKNGYLGDCYRGSGIGVGLGRGAYDTPMDTCANCGFSLPQNLSQQLPDGAPGSPSKDGRGKNGSAMLRTKETYVAGGPPLEEDEPESSDASSSSSSAAASTTSRRRCPSFSKEDHGSSPDPAEGHVDYGSHHPDDLDLDFGSTPPALPYLALSQEHDQEHDHDHNHDKASAASNSSSRSSRSSSSASSASASSSPTNFNSSYSNSTAPTLPPPPPPHSHTLTYLTTRHPPTTKAFSLLRRSCIRTLSCEQIPSTTGPLFYGDRTSGYTSAFVFRLPDPRARGRRRSYALIAVYGGGGNTEGGMGMGTGFGKEYPNDLKDFISQDGGYYNSRERVSGAPRRPENLAILWNEWIRNAFESIALWIMGLAAATAAANSELVSPPLSANSSYQSDSHIGSMSLGSPVSPIKAGSSFAGFGSSSSKSSASSSSTSTTSTSTSTNTSNATSNAIAITGGVRDREKPHTPTSSFLSLRNVDPDGYPRRRGEMRATGLAELVGKEDIFVDLHAVFVQLLSGLSKSGFGLGAEGPGRLWAGEEEEDGELDVSVSGSSSLGLDEMLWDAAADAHQEEFGAYEEERGGAGEEVGLAAMHGVRVGGGYTGRVGV